jgi:hypothetical protein
VSFRGSEKRVRDGREPFGRRVMSLHECLEQFNLFGFTATRERLRAMVSASDEGWTEAQLIEAMDALADARRSWVLHLQRAEARRSAEKPEATPPGRSIALRWHNEWLESYLAGDMAARWMVEGLGPCAECDHLLIHHGTWACQGCSATSDIPWDARCRVKLPMAAPGSP